MENRNVHDPSVTPPNDDDEYELEAPDESIEARRRADMLAAQERRIDIDEIYRDADRNRSDEILQDWVRNFRFRFQLRELLITTAVIAIAVALAELQLFWTAIILLFMLGVGGLYFYLTLQEHKHQAAAERKRDEIYARRRQKLAPRLPGHVEPFAEPEPIAADVSQAVRDIEKAVDPPARAEPIHFRFSTRELIGAASVAAILLTVVRLAGGANIAATILGAIALCGLLAFATNLKPPRIVTFTWWLILIMYVVVTVIVLLLGHAN